MKRPRGQANFWNAECLRQLENAGKGDQQPGAGSAEGTIATRSALTPNASKQAVPVKRNRAASPRPNATCQARRGRSARSPVAPAASSAAVVAAWMMSGSRSCPRGRVSDQAMSACLRLGAGHGWSASR